MKKGNQDTQFRKILLESLQWIQTKKLHEKAVVYLASGFFDEVVKTPRTPISTFLDISTNKCLQNVFSGIKVELFGAYNGKNGLLQFGTSLKQNTSKISAFYKYRFHAKFFAIEVDRKVVFEILGSSNMTVSAYEGLRYTKAGNARNSHNYECDLVLIDSLTSLKTSLTASGSGNVFIT